MKTSLGLSGALAASLALTGAACADAPVGPTASAAEPAAARAIDRQAARAGARLVDNEGSRIAAAIRNPDRRAQLTAALDQLSLALDAGNARGIVRALSLARGSIDAIESDADRDALRLTLDAAEQSLGVESK